MCFLAGPTTGAVHGLAMALSKERKKYLQVFLKQYTSEFGCILASRKGEHFAFCTVCNCDISISHGGRTDVATHVASKKHASNLQSKEKQHRLQQFFGREDSDSDVIRAECLFTDFLLEHNIPLSASEHVGPLLRKMFPKSDVAKRYVCSRTNTTAIVGAMARHAQESTVSALKKGVFSVAIDGSNDSQAQLYPIVVTYFAKEVGFVESKLLALSTLEGQSTGRNIGALIIDTLTSMNIPLSNCIAFGSDNANVMLGRKNGVVAVLTEANENVIIIGCPCHLINIAAEKAASCLPAKVDEVLVDVFFLFGKECEEKSCPETVPRNAQH